MDGTQNNRKFLYLRALPCFVIFALIFNFVLSSLEYRRSTQPQYKTRTLLEVSNGSAVGCIPSGIDSFPADFFTQEQRQKGGVIVHLIITVYACATIGEVCHRYFVPSLEIISERLKLPPDIAGATFMAIGTSAPELFSSLTGSFITEGDIGIGTIIGSAVFNIVGVTGLVGVVLWTKVLHIDWYPIARDCLAYGLTVFTLIWIISDNIVEWWESLILLLIFFLYILIIYYNNHLEKWSRKLVDCAQKKCHCCHKNGEKTALLSGKALTPELVESQSEDGAERDSYSVEITASREREILQKQASIDQLLKEEDNSLCISPSQGGWKLLWWILMYPVKLVLFLTIPDSSKRRLQKFFPITFIMSVLWIGALSYLAVWMVTIIGYTASIPDSVSGLTILAAGTSVPEVISSIIVARNGFGNMAISNLVGSNTFDISFCLGAPWLVKTLMSKTGYLLIFSSALTYTAATLLLTLIFFVLVFVLSGWILNRTVGLVFFFIYGVFVVLACMYEMNIFGEINAKTCD